VIPIGSIEQHGYHLLVGTDTLLAGAVTGAAVQRAIDEGVPTLSLPPMWTGHSPHHKSLGGTISIGVDTVIQVLEDVAASALRNDFDALLLVNGHSGSSALVDSAVSSIGADHDDVEVAAVTYFNLAAKVVAEIRDSESGGMAHGGEFETSLMLHLFPALVRENRDGTPMDEPAERARDEMFADGPLTVYRQFKAYSPSGAIGVPEAATAEKGTELFEYLVGEVADVLARLFERTR